MPSFYSFIAASYLAAVANCHGVILGAQGIAGSPTSVGFQVNPDIARNCTDINPCQQDATLIRDAEIALNIVNSCGRTELSGNIDVGENTENALAAGAVTQVASGTVLNVTIHQVNADGAGPYVCDLDPTSNAAINLVNLEVTNNVPGTNGLSQVRAQSFNINVKMPDDFKCTGGSTGNICTVRCRNNAQAGPFGGCFAVQQTDVEPNVNTPENIPVVKQLDVVNSQVKENQKNFPGAVQANIDAGSDEAVKAKQAVESLLNIVVTSATFTAETPTVVLGPVVPPVTATPAPDAGNGNDNGNDNGNGNGNGNGGGRGRGNGNGNNGNNSNGNGNGNGTPNRFNGGPGRFQPGGNNNRMMRWAKRS